jgi:hypothetical protein
MINCAVQSGFLHETKKAACSSNMILAVDRRGFAAADTYDHCHCPNLPAALGIPLLVHRIGKQFSYPNV